MELWIRSQDKKKLCVAKYFELDNDETGIFCFNGESYSVFVGKYSTKERALEVLDEIQKKIRGTYLMKSKTDLVESRFYEAAKKYHSLENDINIVCGDGMFDIIPINIDFIVYEMPEE